MSVNNITSSLYNSSTNNSSNSTEKVTNSTSNNISTDKSNTTTLANAIKDILEFSSDTPTLASYLNYSSSGNYSNLLGSASDKDISSLLTENDSSAISSELLEEGSSDLTGLLSDDTETSDEGSTIGSLFESLEKENEEYNNYLIEKAQEKLTEPK